MIQRSHYLAALFSLVLCAIPVLAAAQADRGRLENLADQATRENNQRKRAALNRAAQMGIPERHSLGNGKIAELQKFDGDKPVYVITGNATAADTISADEIWPGGGVGLLLDGSGETLGIWDAGSVRNTHQEFTGRVTNLDAAAQSDHSTHVAGTLIAAGVNPSAKGMSFAAGLRSRDWNNDTAEMASDQLLIPPTTISNHSYGFISGWIFNLFADNRWTWFGDVARNNEEDGVFGFYDSTSRDWDQIAYSSPSYLIIKSAGNDRADSGTNNQHWHFNSSIAGFELASDFHPRDGGALGYDSIGGGAGSAKNVITVAAVFDIPGGYTEPTEVQMTSFSGWGPSDDGRIKPDISANGIGLLSTVTSHDAAYSSFSGTSMATPSVAGALGLLTQHAKDLYGSVLLASTMKALIIHTADEAGPTPGPDYSFGWGLINVAEAAQLMSDDASGSGNIYEIALTNQATETIVLDSAGNTPLRVTIAWTDPAGTPPVFSIDPSELMLVNDIDLRLIAPNGAVIQPWVLDPANPVRAAVSGDNFRDNVEQIHIESPLSGSYTLQVNHKGFLDGGTPQQVSLIASGNLDGITPAITSTAATAAQVASPYQYAGDRDNMIAATGDEPLSFSLLSGPGGMSVTSEGLVSWTPTVDQQGSHRVQIQAENPFGSDLQSFSVTVSPAEPPPVAATISFNQYAVSGYAGTQDGAGTVTIEEAGKTLSIIGNRWQKIDFPYNITPDTVIAFDFSSAVQGEIHAIGLDNNTVHSEDFTFQLHGSQSWGIQNFHSYNGDGANQHFIIPVGQFYTGTMQHLFFVTDHDHARANAESRFRNIMVYEANGSGIPPQIISTASTAAQVGIPYTYNTDSHSDNGVGASGITPITYALLSGPAGMTVSNMGNINWTPAPGQEGNHWVQIQAQNTAGTSLQSFTIGVSPQPLPEGTINFNHYLISRYAGSQDGIGTVAIQDSGATVRLSGNRWQKIDFPYNISPNTVLELDFSSAIQGEIHAIGLDNDLNFSANFTFQIYGTQRWGLQDFHSYNSNGAHQHFVIPLGQFYTGTMQYLFFTMDHDLANPDGESRFSNIRVYEAGNAAIAPTITSTASSAAEVGSPYRYSPPDSDNVISATGTAPITFSLIAGPSGMAVSSAGLINWTPAAGQEGSHIVQLQAQNAGGTASQSFTITVTAAPGGTTDNPAKQTQTVNFNDHIPTDYAGSQNKSGDVLIENAGLTLSLTGNRWQKINLPYNITPGTVIAFDFSSAVQGEIHAIGLDQDLHYSENYSFQIYGTQRWGLQDFHSYNSNGASQHFVIPLGQFYTGTMQYLFFTMDHDIANPNGESRFSNVQIYEDPQS